MADSITVTGNLTADPQVQTTPSQKQYLKFSLANTPRRFDATQRQWVDAGETVYVDCIAWDTLAAHIAASARKGTRLIVTGTLTADSWTGKDGKKRTKLQVRVDDAGVSVRRAAVTQQLDSPRQQAWAARAAQGVSGAQATQGYAAQNSQGAQTFTSPGYGATYQQMPDQQAQRQQNAYRQDPYAADPYQQGGEDDDPFAQPAGF
ncbi:MAG: single-stranded DNA-binding protein [Bifidobacteriaceae bacterium]|nr:single-stranded DNA-binding protein [Bifidobacteriaceae bacterium]